ncbi:MAG: hypothetical protein FWD78_08695, partial [Treponema sp.]|nr:hypothetical protein [Treponema sp.]
MNNCVNGFIVHAYADMRRDRLCLIGRLEDGRSFAAIETRWRPSLLIYSTENERCAKILSSVKNTTKNTAIEYSAVPAQTESFEGTEALLELKFDHYSARTAAAKALEQEGIKSPDCDRKIPEAFFLSKGIRGPIRIEGNYRPGKLVDLVFADPDITAIPDISPLLFPLIICSVDIETNVKTETILAIGSSVCVWNKTPEKRSLVRVLLPQSCRNNPPAPACEEIVFYDDEKSMLSLSNLYLNLKIICNNHNSMLSYKYAKIQIYRLLTKPVHI